MGGVGVSAVRAATQGRPQGRNRFAGSSECDKATGQLVYDNVPSASDDLDSVNPQAIEVGNIVIQSNGSPNGK